MKLHPLQFVLPLLALVACGNSRSLTIVDDGGCGKQDLTCASSADCCPGYQCASDRCEAAVGGSSGTSGGTSGGGSSGGTTGTGTSSGGGSSGGSTGAAVCIDAGFADPIVYDGGGGYVVVGDFNGDGFADVATALGGTSNDVYVYLNQGDGTFASQVAYPITNTPSGIAVGDFNGDGFPDLVTTSTGATADVAGSVGVLLNKGDGTFDPQLILTDAGYLDAVAVGDVNGDGKPDIVVANGPNSYTVGVFLNQGNGSFAPQSTYHAGDWPASLALADFNGDGRLDIAEANPGDETVGVLLNNGDGGFAPFVGYPVGIVPAMVAVGDFNLDGSPDLVVANQNAGTVSVLINHRDGTFAPQVVYPAGLEACAVAVADFNGDGYPDLAVSNCATGGGVLSSLDLLMNKGDGTFAAQVDYDQGYDFPTSLAVGDFKGTGEADVAAAFWPGTHTTALGIFFETCGP